MPQRVFRLTISFVFVLLLGWTAQAQKGLLRGTIIDGETGEPLFSANAVLKGTQIGTTTDFDGKFELQAPAGTYDLHVTFIGMQGITISGVEIKPGETKVIDVIQLKPATNELAAVTVTAEATRNTEAALITVKKKSANLIDGISAAKLKETGDGNLGDAVKRITGVSVQGGKYVYVRGLGERYTKSMLNGVNIPGLDPDKNTLQIDIFPSNIVANITIRKTALAELPADFTGGLVDIETKAFPADKIFTLSGGIGFTPSMHFNPNYLSYEGSATDFLGFDGGARTLPEAARSDPIPSPVSGGYSDAEVNSFLQKFSPHLGAQETLSPLNFSLGMDLGNQYTLENGHKLGYIFTANYRNRTDYYDDLAFGEYQVPNDSAAYDMTYATTQNGRLGRNSVLLAGMGGVAYKTLKSKHKLVLTHLQSGESQAAQFAVDNNGAATGQSGYLGFSNNLEYAQRGLSNALLQGNYFLLGSDLEVEWKLAGTLSNIVEPDIRQTRFTIFPSSGDSLFIAGAGGNPRRIWRYLDEVNLEAQGNVDYKHQLGGQDAKLDVGFAYLYKQRDYEILTYDLQSFGASMSSLDFNGDPSAVLADSNLFPNGYNLYYASGNGSQGENPNAFKSNARKFSLYASEELRPFDGFIATLGLRMENYVQRHTGRDALYASTDGAQGNVLNNDVVLDELNFFPSANMAYDFSEKVKLRASYFRSIARPSFKELSFAQILDPLSNRTYNGSLFEYPGSWNGNLVSTLIQNYDLRIEKYGAPGELLSLSFFAKTFKNPIELVRIPAAQTTNEFQARNVGNGRVIGLEMEIRQNLNFVSPALKDFSFSGNLTLVQSQIDMTELEYQNRLDFEKVGQNIDDTRPMAGQAPYVINAGFSYQNREQGLIAGIFYNVKGPTLSVVGGGLFPDVYTDPFHNLKLNINKKLGPENNQTLNFEINNILLDTFDQYYNSFQAEPRVFKAYSPGITFTLGYSYTF